MRIPFLRRQPAVPPRHLIVGLGNPGAEYQHTRHNVGYRTVDRLAREHRIDVRSTQKRSWVGFGQIRGVPVVLARPITFMNLSGESIGPLMRQLQLRPEDVIVVTDDMDLPVGRLRVRRGGSAGGHGGLKSLIRHLGTEEFPRVRIGVGRPPPNREVVEYVLSKFERDELTPIEDAIQRAAEAVETILTDGIEATMTRFNSK